MTESEDKPNMRKKNKLNLELNQDSNDFIKLFDSEIYTKEVLMKQNNSYSSNIDNKKTISNPREVGLLSNILSSANTNNNIKEDNNLKNETNPIILYDKIKLNIENFINEYIKEKNLVIFILKDILTATVIIIKDFIENKSNNLSLSSNNINNNDFFLTEGAQIKQSNSSLFDLDINSKIVFLVKIKKLNERIRKLQEEMDFYKRIINSQKNYKYGRDFANIFKNKIMEQKEKSKKEEIRYLFCIEEQEKKISSLEKELKKKENENLPFETLKSIRCFPYFNQYDFKKDINPKTIPMYHQFQFNKLIKPSKNLSNPKEKGLNKNKSDKNRTQFYLTNALNKYISFEPKKSKAMTLRKCKNENKTINNFSNILNTEENILNNSNMKNRNLTLNDNEKKEDVSIHKIINNYHPKTFLNNKKEFFVAHPTLGSIGVAKKNEMKYAGIPKKILKLKLHKNLEKNMQITFPSSLNETLVNLEKLRKFKNIKNQVNEMK